MVVSSLVIAWSMAVIIGLCAMGHYRWQAGANEASAPAWWPESAAPAIADGRATLLMFVHPQCPCSRASVHELSVLMARTSGAVSAQVLFAILPGMNPHDFGPLWQEATSIPGVRVLVDPDGAQATHFGAAVSGHVVLYDLDGRLLFSGGITDGRGHEGDNAGLDAAVDSLHSGVAHRATPVFGCPLFNPSTAPTEGESVRCQR